MGCAPGRHRYPPTAPASALRRVRVSVTFAQRRTRSAWQAAPGALAQGCCVADMLRPGGQGETASA